MNQNENKDLLTIDEELSLMAGEVPEMPAGFHAAWMSAVEGEKNMSETNPASKPETRKKSFRWSSLIAVAAALVLLVGGTAVSRDSLPGAKQSSYSYSNNETLSYGSTSSRSAKSATGNSTMLYSTADMEEAAYEVAYDNASAKEAPREQKIIRTVSMTIGTKAYDDLYASVRASCTGMGGWVEYASESSSSSSGLRSVSLTLRVPADRLDEFTNTFSGEGRLIRRSESAYDVSESYYDTKGRLETQLALMERLRALVTDAADLKDLLALESQIADTQYTIDNLQSSLNGTDRQVNYATVELTLKEETDASDVQNENLTFFQRLGAALKNGFSNFGSFMEDLAVFTVASVPVILLLAVVVTIVVIPVRKARKKKTGR